MAIITRKDGTQFVSPDFRERLTGKKTSLLKSEVSTLSKSYGDLIYIQKNQDNSFEVAFSEEPGFLLAESVSKHLRAFESFIYIEEIKYTNKVVMVVMKDGEIQRDTHILAEALHDELAILSSDETQYDFYIFGKVDVSETDNGISFDASSMAKSFTIMEESVVEALPRFNEYELLKITDAFKRAELSTGISKKTALIIIVVFGVVFGWLMMPSENENINKGTQNIQTITVKSEYYDYAQTLNQPTVNSVTSGITEFSNLLYDLPAGWKPISISASKKKIEATITNAFPVQNYQVLHDWTSAHSIQMKINNGNVLLTFNTAYPTRGIYHSIYNIKNVLRVVMDRLQSSTNTSNINLSDPEKVENYYTQDLNINFSGISSDTIGTIAQQLSDLPVNFDKLNVSVDSNGLYSGEMKITIIGN